MTVVEADALEALARAAQERDAWKADYETLLRRFHALERSYKDLQARRPVVLGGDTFDDGDAEP